MGEFIPAFVSALKGGTVGKGASLAAKTGAYAAQGVKIAAVTKSVSEVAKASVPKPSPVPTQITQPSTTTTIQTQPQGQEEDRRQMDLLSTIIAGRERKNKLG